MDLLASTSVNCVVDCRFGGRRGIRHAGVGGCEAAVVLVVFVVLQQ